MLAKNPLQRKSHRTLFWLALVLYLLVAAPATRADTLRVAAAANLQRVFTEALIPAFEKAYGATVTPTFGSTKLLASQIEQGAPVDVFVAADTASVVRLAAKGLVEKASVSPYAIGQLVLWTRQDSPLHPSRVEDLSDPRYVHVAIANPAVAPYGVAADQALDHAGLTSTIKDRLVYAENIDQALQFARSGAADAAFTALSLVIEDTTDPYVIVPAADHAPIIQSAGIVSASTSQALASRFLAFLTGPQAASTWHRYGYELPAAAPTVKTP
ncbi:MAG: molybdate ABC transporter substrate-binding protein [Capsulimonadaceae bacterium]